MFDNFLSPNTSYTPNIFQPKYPTLQKEEKLQSINPNKPYEIIGKDGLLKGYFWYYGNSVDLVFDITGEITLEQYDTYINISEIINTLDVNATIYNLRYEPVIHFSNGLDADYLLNVENKEIDEVTGKVATQIIIPITKELSTLKMPRGTYFLN